MEAEAHARRLRLVALRTAGLTFAEIGRVLGITRAGAWRLWKEAVKKGEKNSRYLDELVKLAGTMKLASKCGLGQSVGNAFKSIVDNFKEEIIY